VATACAKAPAGWARWTLELLAGEMVKLPEHSKLSHETVRRRLAENDLKLWRKDMWCIPEVDGTYVARMEDVLDLYAEAADPKRSVVCFDESALAHGQGAAAPAATSPNACVIWSICTIPRPRRSASYSTICRPIRQAAS
jgi:hypothetical protein